MLARVLAGARGDLGGQQVHDRAVLVGGPDGAVAAQEAGPGALLAAEAERAVEQPGANHLKPTGTSASVRPRLRTTRSIMLLLTSVLPTAAPRRPVGPMGKQVADRDGQVMVRVHQARRLRHDAVPVRSRDRCRRRRRTVLELDQAGHRVGAGAVHADLAVVVDRHEPEGRVDRRVGDGDVQAVRSAIGCQ